MTKNTETPKTSSAKDAPENLNEEQLEQVQGAGKKGLLGDEVGILNNKIKPPQPNSLERVFEDE